MSEHGARPSSPAKVALEAWSQGCMIGALIIMIGITFVNMRRGVLLHKLILIELLLAMPNGFFTFFDPPTWGWYLSSTVIFLVISWNLHNVIAWLKNKPFLSKRYNTIYIGTIILVQPYWVLEIYANFTYFNPPYSRLFVSTRPLEAVCRDPWWIFTALNLFWNIKYRYEFKPLEIVRVSPRFGLLLLSMTLSIIFITVDLFSVTPVIPIGYINPFWKFAFIFKCFTDTIVLDDFKTALDKLSRYKMEQNYPLPFSRPRSHIEAQPPGSSLVHFDVICPVESSRLVTVEHLEKADNSPISCPPRAVRASDTGLVDRV
ncbi:hypothetical protein FOPG_17444 [Fusarium oxysporum f. sp. conglutinans race 2 54008]|nr:hypothetical protein FOPG_17444 [Fusarium oxysporum f. sp. conglutinans race 2 54008]KAG6997294.1 hypothetical protein FocnCong_v016190 [Fusarium oxysporum f. sp. conglutinans]KAH7205078.1 hypothetical protein BKA60DRAFT_527000 [Fusarium oxysporum]KAH7463248.1 hypothetical protein FOMA001_g18022 [Fusarium oxysporum f. sp. matthiolae]KAI8412187.1 hypothetical protein FOFC_08817 [Fusarium oxysporum]